MTKKLQALENMVPVKLKMPSQMYECFNINYITIRNILKYINSLTYIRFPSVKLKLLEAKT